jgi:Carbohydrate family 9 binding domain-like
VVALNPELRCVCRAFGPLSCDPASPEWRDVEAVELSLAANGAPPEQRTSVRTAWDEREWRVLFHCQDLDPWATMTVRDEPLYKEETVEVFFDPVGDLESYFEIEVNPLSAVLDIVFRRSRSGYKGDSAWDCAGLCARARIIEGGWLAELAIPFAAVAAAPRPGAEWRVNFCRIDRPSRDGSLPRELTAWSPPMRENFHTPERFGVLRFEM